jgi:hypothetical protein
MPMRQQATGQVRPIWASMWLLAYFLSATPLLPIATALVAWVDGEHRVALSADKDGTRVVLGHDARDPRKAFTHLHCAVSRVLTLLAKPSGPDHADHVLNFQCGSSTTLREATPCVAVPQADAGPVAPASVPAVVLPSLVSNVEARLLDIPPPAMAVMVARATVLLI